MKFKRTLFYFSALALTVSFLMSSTLKEEKGAFQKDFKVTWENSKAYALAIAEAMPENKFNFKPTDEVRDFAGQLKHISFSNYFMPGVFIEGKDIQFDPDYENNKSLVGGSKKEIIQLMSDRFDAVSQLVSNMSDKQLQETVVLPFFNNKEVTKEELLVWIKNHTAHHSAQAIVYLRLNGITPPAYNGW